MQEHKNTELVPSNLSFESLKKLNKHGIEYWSAKDLQPCLGYSEWRKFENTIKKAIKSCEGSKNNPKNHFVGADKMVQIGSQTERKVPDWHLSRFACYLIVQNGDPRKPEIAEAQKYFAIQTRRQELKALAGAAGEAGYQGLYGGLSVDAIKARKGINPQEQLTDWMDRTELAANQFRISQTREKLKREGINNPKDAIAIYEAVGKEVRAVISKIGGTLPEHIPPAEHIKSVEK